jgi:tetratricopeptide (TPR) repeat protein
VFALLTLAFLGLRRTLLGAATLPAAHGDPLVAMMTFAAIAKKTLVGQLVPVNLSLSHAFGPTRVVNADAFLACGLLAALLVASAALRRRTSLAAFAAWWFPVGLLPLAALPMITPLALYQENRGYLSAVALAMLAGPVMAWWWGADGRAVGEGVPAERSGPVVMSGARWLRRGLLVGLFAVMAVAVVQRNPVWRDDLTLWTDVLNKAPGNLAAYVIVGGGHQARGDLDAAAEVYQRALERFPNNGILHNNLGAIYRSRGDLARATQAFQAAIRTTPGFAMPYLNLGLILQGAGYRREATIAYERFLELAPGQQGTAPHVPKARERLSALRGDQGRAPRDVPGAN